MHLQESGEMYLETILVLSEQNNYVRSIDVGEYMGYSKPSVSRAIGLLKNGGYVTVNHEGHLFLTDAGKEVAEKIYSRHKVLTKFLVKIGVNEETAAEDACRIEHCISDASFEAIRKYANV
ncbi:MAG: metal-dependent transcriptional regulator [Faecalibacterium sp.]|nr:metal-dependent transcriptional regulator [Ruminococcus sp.]MCM1392318.1 metal-dependent transcriptional regulator [Ruminococcus sp.]MCM1486057.1 metal-dependent transcriptional regulator [Faecalibacterium sp.]